MCRLMKMLMRKSHCGRSRHRGASRLHMKNEPYQHCRLWNCLRPKKVPASSVYSLVGRHISGLQHIRTSTTDNIVEDYLCFLCSGLQLVLWAGSAEYFWHTVKQ